MPGMIPIVIGGGVAYLAYKALSKDKGTSGGATASASAGGASASPNPNESISGQAPSEGAVKPGLKPAESEPLPTDSGNGTTSGVVGRTGLKDGSSSGAVAASDTPAIPDPIPKVPRGSQNLADAPGEMGGITAPPSKTGFLPGTSLKDAGLSASPVVEENRLHASTGWFGTLRF